MQFISERKQKKAKTAAGQEPEPEEEWLKNFRFHWQTINEIMTAKNARMRQLECSQCMGGSRMQLQTINKYVLTMARNTHDCCACLWLGDWHRNCNWPTVCSPGCIVCLLIRPSGCLIKWKLLPMPVPEHEPEPEPTTIKHWQPNPLATSSAQLLTHSSFLIMTIACSWSEP